jgi:hypothetical protein
LEHGVELAHPAPRAPPELREIGGHAAR